MVDQATRDRIYVGSDLSLRNSFAFPLQRKVARREVVIGALWIIFLPPIGWILNMGHRIMMVHNMQHGRSAWPSWQDYPSLFKHGFLTFLGMVEYHAPSVLIGFWARQSGNTWLYALSGLLWGLATVAVPGFMSHYCRAFDAREIFDPRRALRRVFEGGAAYWKAWGIVLAALSVSFLGLLAAGIGFFFTSVWFWQTAGFSFATVFSQKFALMDSVTAPAGEESGVDL